MNLLSDMTKKLLITTAVFLLYGYLCRFLGLYFFWESKTVGWVLFWITVVFILRDRLKEKKIKGRKVLLEKIGIGFSIFVVLIKGGLFFETKRISAYDSAVRFIKTNPELQSRVGIVNGIFLIPYGAFSITKNSQGIEGQADLHFIVKGSKKFEDLNLLMNKDFDQDWKITVVRP